MWLIAGLGNPGPAHHGQRHNIGFMALDRIVADLWPMGRWRNQFQGETVEFTAEGQKILALKPQTFMNNSGQSLGEAVKFYKIPLASVVVVHDDIDLDTGRIEIKLGGGHGGHNGLKSIDAHIGKEYWRVRLGIGHPVKLLGLEGVPKEHKDALVTQHVLSRFVKQELTETTQQLTHVAEAVPVLLRDGIEAFRAYLI